MNRMIQQKIRQYLVHSFLYYQLNESIISDNYFDLICKNILNFLENNSEENFTPYQDILTSSLSSDASGYTIRKFPAEIISTSLHLLYQKKYKETMSFNTFLARFGYRL